MNIVYDDKTQIIKLDTQNTTYAMQVLRGGILAHLYYGPRLAGMDIAYLVRYKDRGFSGNPVGFEGDRGFSLDTIPQEYPGFDVGDYRQAAVRICRESGSSETDFRYERHEIREEKYVLPGLPACWGGPALTLAVYLSDVVSGAQVCLLYGIFAGQDVITRAVEVQNRGAEPFCLQSVFSLSVDLPHMDFDLLELPGRYCRERQLQRSRLRFGTQSMESLRGHSSHQHNPFLALVAPEATASSGECFGFNLLYSGSFWAGAQCNHDGSTRVLSGINPVNFAWRLEPGESFTAPEAVMAYSEAGLNGLSGLFHRFFNQHLIRGPWRNKRRPVLINNWEATYFDFDTEKLLAIARRASEIGVELFVLDDGWFGERNNDTSSLGDWFVNTQKLTGGLAPLVKEVKKLGMAFGLWVEPEMVSQDSTLYRQHPDWCLHAPGRAPSTSRGQLVLDMGRGEVVEYLFGRLAALIEENGIDYIKWDFNRSLSEVSSYGRQPGRQQETGHRFVLGTYRLLEMLTARFPHVLFEGCAGGGGRFDAGMLYYTPQIWASDCTDAVERLYIQYGTALAYPLSCLSAHVSTVPNHQTGSTASLYARGVVASQAAAFGYELDLSRVTQDELAQMSAQIQRHKQDALRVMQGTYYSLISPYDGKDMAVWCMVDSDRRGFTVAGASLHTQAYALLRRVRLCGINARAQYICEETSGVYLGDTLMKAGLNLPEMNGQAQAFQLHFKEVGQTV